MAARYPLVVDTTDDNKIKELPSGDDLNLTGNNVVNVVNVTATGTIEATNVTVNSTNFTVNGDSLDTVAFSGSYTDLSNRPTLFSGDYADLDNKPTLKTTIESLDNVGSTAPTQGQILVYDDGLGRYEPGSIGSSVLSTADLEDIGDVVLTGDRTSDILKWSGSGWINSRVEFSELTSTPTTLSGYGITDALQTGSAFDVKGSVFADDSTVLVDAVNGEIPGYVKIADLKTALQDGAGDYAAFKAWVLANL